MVRTSTSKLHNVRNQDMTAEINVFSVVVMKGLICRDICTTLYRMIPFFYLLIVVLLGSRSLAK